MNSRTTQSHWVEVKYYTLGDGPAICLAYLLVLWLTSRGIYIYAENFRYYLYCQEVKYNFIRQPLTAKSFQGRLAIVLSTIALKWQQIFPLETLVNYIGINNKFYLSLNVSHLYFLMQNVLKYVFSNASNFYMMDQY